jgi:hypothetical protein
MRFRARAPFFSVLSSQCPFLCFSYRVRVAVEQAKLEQLPQAGHHARPDEGVHINPGRGNAGRVGAAQALNPFHDEHARARQVAPHPRDFHGRVARKVAPKVFNVAGLLVVVQLLQQLLAELVHDQLRIAAQAAQRDGRDERGQRAEQHQVLHDDGPHARPLHLDGDRLPRLPQDGPVDLAQRGGGDGAGGDRGEDGAHGRAQVGLHDLVRLLIREGGHVVLERAQFVHVILPHDVGAGGQDLAGLDEGGAQGGEGGAQGRRPRAHALGLGRRRRG